MHVRCTVVQMILYVHAESWQHVIMGAIVSQITSLTIVYSTVYSESDQRKHQSSASLAFVWGIHRWPVNSPHKWPVTREMVPFDDVIIYRGSWWCQPLRHWLGPVITTTPAATNETKFGIMTSLICEPLFHFINDPQPVKMYRFLFYTQM